MSYFQSSFFTSILLNQAFFGFALNPDMCSEKRQGCDGYAHQGGIHIENPRSHKTFYLKYIGNLFSTEEFAFCTQDICGYADCGCGLDCYLEGDLVDIGGQELRYTVCED